MLAYIHTNWTSIEQFGVLLFMYGAQSRPEFGSNWPFAFRQEQLAEPN